VALTLLDDGTLVELDGALVVSPAGELVLPDAESSLLEHAVRTSRPAARLPATNTTRFMPIPFVQSSGSCEGNSGIRRWPSERHGATVDAHRFPGCPVISRLAIRWHCSSVNGCQRRRCGGHS